MLKSCVNNNTNSIKSSLSPLSSPPAQILLLVANIYLMGVGMGGKTYLKTKQSLIQKSDLYGKRGRINANTKYESVKWG